MAKQPNNMPAGVKSGKLTELRKRIFFVLGALLVFRIGTFISVPGVNPIKMAQIFDQQKDTVIGLFNMFSGGAFERFSLFALGIMPYISAAIIMQLLSHVLPSMIALRKEGQAGQRKITQYTRYATVVLATFQAFGVAVTMGGQEGFITAGMSHGQFVFIAAVTLVTGTMFLMWLGEQITERGIGNGISILIFAGIVAGLPSGIAQLFSMVGNSINHFELIIIFVIVILVTAFVVFVERGQRRITVNYAKKQQGRKMYQAQASFLPLKLNMAGVIPPIFASALILFPTTIATWMGSKQGGEQTWLTQFANMLGPGEPLYLFLYSFLIIFFCFFYTALTFNSRETAENLKKSGAFIPGIRPGEQTARYVDNVLTRLTTAGAIYITTVCLIPELLRMKWNIPFYFGGTSLLIVVIVVMDFMAQMQAHLMSHQYESLMKKSNFKGFDGGAGTK